MARVLAEGDKYKQPDIFPTRKVAGSTLGGAGVTVLVWIAGLFNHTLPPEVAAALVVIVMAGVGYAVRSTYIPPAKLR